MWGKIPQLSLSFGHFHNIFSLVPPDFYPDFSIAKKGMEFAL